ncbi:MAG: DegT/DnrJ/EryC1/StrS family aminotransferase [Parcubacteria group bacterium]|nr:DegT/DnrJ/EryC1/StrS family aminotransferase [Parcubacteria group bacterium]
MNPFLLNLQILSSIWDVISKQDFYLGPTVERFDTLLRDFTGSKHALGVSSGTDALILSLKALGVGPGDEIIVPAISFFSTASAVSWVGARPVFVDIDIKTYTINPNLIERAITQRTKGVIPVHLNGGAAEMESIMTLAKKHGIYVIVDASQSLGVYYKNLPMSAWGDLVCLSFSFNKKELGGYGNAGAVLTNNNDIYKKISLFRAYGTSSKKEMYSNHVVASGSYRIDSLQAAILSCKIPYWNEYIRRRREKYILYKKLLKNVPRIILPDEGQNCLHSGYRFIFLTPHRDELRKFLRHSQIRSPNYYDIPLPFFPAFNSLEYSSGDFPVSEKFARESISLPTDNAVTKKSAEWVINLVKTFLEKQK